MKMRLAWLALAAMLLAACAPVPTRPGVVYDKAREELQDATQRKQADDEAALLPPLSVEMPKNAETEPRFDLSVINAPAAQVFMALVTGTRYNMLVTPDVTGQITLRLKDVTVKEALESIRDLYGYEFAIRGNRITIQPNTVQTRVFHVNYLAMRRLGGSDLRVTSGASSGVGSGNTNTAAPTGTPTPVPAGTGAPTQSQPGMTSRVQTATENDFWGSITTALRAIVGGEDSSVVVNQQSGVVVVRALPAGLRAVEEYLKATQVIVDRQVILEAKIIDVTLSQDFQSGINWAAFRSGPNSHAVAGVAGSGANLYTAGSAGAARAMTGGSTSTVTPGQFGSVVAQALGKGFFGLSFQTSNFAALMNFLETQGSVSVLSSPRIATLNNQKAVLKVGTDDLFVTNITTTTTSTTSGSVSTPSLTLQSYFSGISLDVTPQIDADNNIILHIHPAVSVVTEKTKNIDLGTTLGQFSLPLASSSVNETDSIIRARDGNIIAIGGLMRQEQDVSSAGLPGASRGGLGSVLGQRGNTLNKRELVILLKPTVITDDKDWAREIEQTNARLQGMDPSVQFNRADRQ